MSTYTYSDMKPTMAITKDGNIERIYDWDVIVQSVKTILSTVSGERVRNPIGARTIRLLFNPMSPDMARQIRNEIVDSILQHEPRVSIDTFTVTPNYDGNYYDVYMVLRAEGLSQRYSETIKLRSFAGEQL